MDPLNISEIFSYVGVDSIRFGMSPEEVAMIWGAPDRVNLNFLNERVEFRNGISTTYSQRSALVEIGLPKVCINARINGVWIFRPPKQDRLAELLALDNSAWEDVGMIAFKTLGISITGFTHADNSDLAMSIFARGHWDEDFESMTEYRHPS